MPQAKKKKAQDFLSMMDDLKHIGTGLGKGQQRGLENAEEEELTDSVQKMGEDTMAVMDPAGEAIGYAAGEAYDAAFGDLTPDEQRRKVVEDPKYRELGFAATQEGEVSPTDVDYDQKYGALVDSIIGAASEQRFKENIAEQNIPKKIEEPQAPYIDEDTKGLGIGEGAAVLGAAGTVKTGDLEKSKLAFDNFVHRLSKGKFSPKEIADLKIQYGLEGEVADKFTDSVKSFIREAGGSDRLIDTLDLDYPYEEFGSKSGSAPDFLNQEYNKIIKEDMGRMSKYARTRAKDLDALGSHFDDVLDDAIPTGLEGDKVIDRPLGPREVKLDANANMRSDLSTNVRDNLITDGDRARDVQIGKESLKADKVSGAHKLSAESLKADKQLAAHMHENIAKEIDKDMLKKDMYNLAPQLEKNRQDKRLLEEFKELIGPTEGKPVKKVDSKKSKLLSILTDNDDVKGAKKAVKDGVAAFKKNPVTSGPKAIAKGAKALPGPLKLLGTAALAGAGLYYGPKALREAGILPEALSDEAKFRKNVADSEKRFDMEDRVLRQSGDKAYTQSMDEANRIMDQMYDEENQ